MLPRAVGGRWGLLVPALLLGLAGCSGGGGGAAAPAPGVSLPARSLAPGSSRAAPAAPGDWITYHGNGLRTGDATGVAPLGTLATAWTTHLDGAVYGQPLLVRGRVLAATESDSVYALDPADGHVLWRSHLATPVPLSQLPCGDIDPLGITGTPAYDPATGLVFVAAETGGGHHQLFGLDTATGAVRVSRAADPPEGDPLAHQQRSALAVADGRVYVAYGGLEGDCGQYIGSVVSVPDTGSGPETGYAVPTSREGGIWAPGGPVVDGDRLLVAVGNGAATGGAYDGSDSVLSLSPDLRRTDYFAPSRWPQDNADDADLGSLTPVRVGRYVLADGKSGTAYLLDARHLGGVGGQLSQAAACPAYGSAAVSGQAVYLPCQDGLLQLTVRGGGLTTGWRFPLRKAGSPAIGGGAVWVADYGTGMLYALDPAGGGVRAQLSLGGQLPHFVSPTLAGNRVYVGTMNGVTAVSGA
jgi:outer membrane protein assembly factor BamB